MDSGFESAPKNCIGSSGVSVELMALSRPTHRFGVLGALIADKTLVSRRDPGRQANPHPFTRPLRGSWGAQERHAPGNSLPLTNRDRVFEARPIDGVTKKQLMDWVNKKSELYARKRKFLKWC